MVRTLLLCLIAAPALAQNRLETVLADGVFGVPWTATLDDVQKQLPGGKVQQFEGGVTNYEVRDGRTVFEVERRTKDTLAFAFRDGVLGAVTVNFKDCVVVYGKVTKFFGTPTTPINPDPNQVTMTFMPMGSWVSGQFTMNLAASFDLKVLGATSGCMLVFSKDIGTVEATPEGLGLK